MFNLVNFLLSTRFYLSLAVIIVAVVFWVIFRKALKKMQDKNDKKSKKALSLRLVARIIKFVIIVAATILVLQINGINVSSLVAGLGIVSVIVGFALQDILKDFIMGIYIVWDNFFTIGDVVSYGDITEGEVIGFNLKSTKIYDVNTGNTITVSNRNISEILKISTWLDIGIPASYKENLEKIRQIMNEIAERALSIEGVTDSKFLGTDEFKDSLIIYKIRVFCPADKKAPIKRAVNGLIQDVYNEHSIEIPFNQLDVHLDK